MELELELKKTLACGCFHVSSFSMSSLEAVSVWHKAQVDVALVTEDVCFSCTVWHLASGSLFLLIIIWHVVNHVILHFRYRPYILNWSLNWSVGDTRFWRHTGSSTFCCHCFMDSHQTLGHIHLEVEEILDVFGLDIGPLGIQPVLQPTVDHNHVKSMCNHSQGPLF